MLPPLDFVAMYEQDAQTTLPREPTWAQARDPLYGQPIRQQQRQAAVRAVWGSLDACWMDILHSQGMQRFIPSYVVYLSFQ